MKYIAALIALVLVAGALVFYSQWRPRRQAVSGFVEAHEIRVGSRVGGRIERVLVAEGDTVQPGQPLVQLAPFDLLERRAEAAATLAARKADLDRLTRGYRAEDIAQAAARRDQLAARLRKLKAGPRPQEKEIARAQVEMAQATANLAQQKFKRTREIFERGQATADEMDQATQQMRTAEAQLQIRRQELSLAEEGTRAEEIAEAEAQLAEAQAAWELVKHGYRREQIDAARAAVDAAQAALGTIQKQIDELTIKAEVRGQIEALDFRPGDLVMPNAPVLSLMEAGNLWVRAYVPENRLDLKLHQIVPITVDSRPGEKYEGEITFISRSAEFTPRNVQTIEERSKQVFRIKVTLRGKALEELRPGMIGDVWLGGK